MRRQSVLATKRGEGKNCPQASKGKEHDRAKTEKDRGINLGGVGGIHGGNSRGERIHGHFRR